MYVVNNIERKRIIAKRKAYRKNKMEKWIY